MRALLLVSDGEWSARARAFVLAARGLAARGHDVVVACASDCPIQVRLARMQLPVVTLRPNASTAGDALLLRRAFMEREVDVVFVHTDTEHLAAGSALRFGRGAGAVIRRVPPFAVAQRGHGARLATRMAASGLLFSTAADRDAADAGGYRLPAAVAPLGLDPAEHDATRAIARSEIGIEARARLIVCLHDGVATPQALAAMRTVSLLSSRHPELHLAILGAARQDDLRMHAAALGIGSRVSFLGARDDEPAVLRAADVGWIAADGDAAAFGALDFMAFRVPIITERCALTEHYIADGIAGVLLGAADPPRTAAAVAAFLARDDQRIAMGNAGRARLQREFALEPMIRGFEDATATARQLAQRAG